MPGESHMDADDVADALKGGSPVRSAAEHNVALGGPRDQDALDALRAKADLARATLHAAVGRECPEPGNHQPVQHRDGKPPWCSICGRTSDGRMVGTPRAKRVDSTSYTREVLIDLALRALRQATVDTWHDRDSASACTQLGEGLALLLAGAEFVVHGEKGAPGEGDPATDENTIWVTHRFPGFDAFENGRDKGDGYWAEELTYIPTAARLDRGGDWY